MTLPPVAPPSSLRAADRPGDIFHTEPCPGSTTMPCASIASSSIRSQLWLSPRETSSQIRLTRRLTRGPADRALYERRLRKTPGRRVQPEVRRFPVADTCSGYHTGPVYDETNADIGLRRADRSRDPRGHARLLRNPGAGEERGAPSHRCARNCRSASLKPPGFW